MSLIHTDQTWPYRYGHQDSWPGERQYSTLSQGEGSTALLAGGGGGGEGSTGLLTREERQYRTLGLLGYSTLD